RPIPASNRTCTATTRCRRSVAARYCAAARGPPAPGSPTAPSATTSPRTAATCWPGSARQREPMRICLVTPHPVRSAHGNGVTAARWAAILDELGHTVETTQHYHDQPADLLLALHARRSADAVRRFHARFPSRPIVLALTGTDLYPALDDDDLPVLRLADRIVVLQAHGVAALPPGLRARTRVVYQSAPTPARTGVKHTRCFDVALLAHLRDVKDPLLAARAAVLLPARSRVLITHAGTVIEEALADEIRQQSHD